MKYIIARVPKKKTLHPEKCLTKHRHFTSHPMATWWLKLDSFPVISYKPSFSFVTIFQGLGQLNHYSGIPLDSCMNSYESIILTYHFWMDPTCAASKRCAAKAPAPCCKSLRAWNLEFWDGRWTFERIFHWFLEGFQEDCGGYFGGCLFQFPMMLGDLWRIFEDLDSSGLFLDHWNSCAFSGCNFAIMNSCVERKVNRRSVPGSASVSADRFIGSKALDPSLTRMRTFSARRFGHLHRAKINGRKKGLKECQRLTTEITRSPWSLPIIPSSHLSISGGQEVWATPRKYHFKG